jgi:uncharacterized protein YcnI
MKLRRRVVLGITGALILAVVIALPASAHVTVNPDEASQGGFARLAFRVPNERANAGTVKLEVQLPADHPIPSVGVQPHPGWAYRVQTATLPTPIETEDGDKITEAVSTITWTGGPIKPGEFEEFAISLGPLPKDTTSLVFKAVQTYDNGEVVRWIEESQSGQPEPEHPAPVLTLTKGSSRSSSGGDAKKSDVNGAKGMALAGIILGVIGIGTATLAIRRRPRPPTTP